MRTVNITLKIHENEIVNFESWLNHKLEVISFRIIPDTERLYEEDMVFRKLVKAEKKAREVKEKYINDHNK